MQRSITLNNVSLFTPTALASSTQKKQLDPKQAKQLKASCEDFEAILIQSMLKSMRDTLPKDGIFKKDMADNLYESMYDEALANKIAHGNNSLGIGLMLYTQLSQISKDSKD